MNNSCSLLVYRWPQPETIHRPHIWNSIGSWGWENGTEEIPTANGIVPRNLARNNVRKYMWHVVQALKSASFCVYVWAQRATKCRKNSIHRVQCTLYSCEWSNVLPNSTELHIHAAEYLIDGESQMQNKLFSFQLGRDNTVWIWLLLCAMVPIYCCK